MHSLAGRLVNLGLLILLFGLAGHYALGELSMVGSAFETIKRDEVAPEHTVATTDGDTDNAEVGDVEATVSYPSQGNGSAPGEPASRAGDALPAPRNDQVSDDGVAGHVKAFMQAHLPGGQTQAAGGPAAAPHISPENTVAFPLSALLCHTAGSLKQAVSAMESHQTQALDDLLVSRNPGLGQCFMAPPGKHYRVAQVSYNDRYPSIATLSIVAESGDNAQALWALNIGASVVQR